MSTNNNKNKSPKQQQQQQQVAAAAATHINPFYIDPGELEKEWQGDYEWEDEYEAEGLLSTRSSNDDVENGSQQHRSRSSSPRCQSSAAMSKKKNAAASKNRQQQLPHVGVKGQVQQRQLSRGQKRWICIVGFFALVIFFILSSTSNNSNNNKDNNNNHNNNNNDAGEIAAKSDNDENNHDNNNNNNAAAINDDDDAPPLPGGGGGNNDDNDEPSVSFVHRVVMLGERQTGVDAFRKHWADCFPNRNFTTFLTRKTYWFQDLTQPPPELIENSKKERILFVLLVRNPYTWVEAMRGHPLYMSAHVNQTTHKALSWQDFVTRPWMPLTTESTDNTAGTTTTATAMTNTCQLDFAPNQVMPCHVPPAADLDDNAHPADVYELKPAAATGRSDSSIGEKKKKNDLAFANILALRAAKLQHFISDLPQAYQDFNLMATLPLKSSKKTLKTSTLASLIDNNVLIIHYEDDLVLSMKKLEQVTGWKPVKTCHQAKRFPPTIRLENLDPEYIQFLSQDSNTGLYWELETLIGYQKAAL